MLRNLVWWDSNWSDKVELQWHFRMINLCRFESFWWLPISSKSVYRNSATFKMTVKPTWVRPQKQCQTMNTGDAGSPYHGWNTVGERSEEFKRRKKKPEADSIFNALDNMMNYNIHIEDKNRTRHTNPKTENKYPDKRTNENGKSTNRKPTFYMFIFRVLKNITW